jgi:hypothetical protein
MVSIRRLQEAVSINPLSKGGFMDIHCKFCGEPSDHDELHEQQYSYEVMSKNFRLFGCGIFDHVYTGKPLIQCRNPVLNANIAELSGVMQGLTPYPEEWSLDFDELTGQL